jgi:hypothetical protein
LMVFEGISVFVVILSHRVLLEMITSILIINVVETSTLHS